MQVDAAVAGLITALPWGRFETLLTAKIIEADPERPRNGKIWEAERFVRAGRSGQSGLKFLIAKANAGDVIWFMATLNRIAEILRLQATWGQPMFADPRRSASWLSQQWRCNCCGNSVTNSVPPPNPSSPVNRSRMNPTRPSGPPSAGRRTVKPPPKTAREPSRRRSRVVRR